MNNKTVCFEEKVYNYTYSLNRDDVMENDIEHDYDISRKKYL